MLLRKLTCLLLSVVFLLATAVPLAIADGTSPPTGGGDIHPWDNSDDFRFGGPLTVIGRNIVIVGLGPGGMYMPMWFRVPADVSKTRVVNKTSDNQEKRTPSRVAKAVRK